MHLVSSKRRGHRAQETMHGTLSIVALRCRLRNYWIVTAVVAVSSVVAPDGLT